MGAGASVVLMIFFSMGTNYQIFKLPFALNYRSMVFAVLADEWQKKELIPKGIPSGCEFIWADSLRALVAVEADAYMDLLFSMDEERTERLNQLPDKPIFINSVIYTTSRTGSRYIRI